MDRFEDIEELGVASVETRGVDGEKPEIGGRQPLFSGISED